MTSRDQAPGVCASDAPRAVAESRRRTRGLPRLVFLLALDAEGPLEPFVDPEYGARYLTALGDTEQAAALLVKFGLDR
jgi:hypothetical protein